MRRTSLLMLPVRGQLSWTSALSEASRGAQLDKHVFRNSQRVACSALPPGSDSLGWKILGRQLGQHEDTLGLRDFVSRTAYVCCKPSPPSDDDLQLGICKS